MKRQCILNYTGSLCSLHPPLINFEQMSFPEFLSMTKKVRFYGIRKFKYLLKNWGLARVALKSEVQTSIE